MLISIEQDSKKEGGRMNRTIEHGLGVDMVMDVDFGHGLSELQ